MVDIPSSDGGVRKNMLVRVQSWAPSYTNLEEFLGQIFVYARVRFQLIFFLNSADP